MNVSKPTCASDFAMTENDQWLQGQEGVVDCCTLPCPLSAAQFCKMGGLKEKDAQQASASTSLLFAHIQLAERTQAYLIAVPKLS